MAAIDERIQRAITGSKGRDRDTFDQIRNELFNEIMTAAVTRHALPSWLAMAVSDAAWNQWHLHTIGDRFEEYHEIPMAPL